jgi:hypothetical protein
MSLAYGEESGGRITLDGEESFAALLMSRLDFDVRVFDIPPVPDKEVEGLIRLRLRSVYPGNPAETAFDFRVVRRGRVRRAVVFIARRRTVDAYREAAGKRPLLLPYLLLEGRAQREEDLRAWVCNGRWAELLTWKDGVLASSVVRRMTRGRRFDLSSEETRLSAEERTGRLTVVAPAEELQGMEKVDGVSFLSLEALPGPRRSADGLFAAQGRLPVVPPVARLVGMSAVLLLLGVMAFFKYVGSVEAYDARLKARAASLQAGNSQVLAVQGQIDTLTARAARLDAQQPRDLYLLLSELSAVLGDNALIRSLTVRDDGLQVDAAGTNPLKLMEGFKSRRTFTDIKLAQVVPDPKTGRELFSFSGTFRPRGSSPPGSRPEAPGGK